MSARASAGWLLLQFAAARALWFLFVGKLTVDEALFGLVGAGVTAFASQAVMGRHLARCARAGATCCRSGACRATC